MRPNQGDAAEHEVRRRKVLLPRAPPTDTLEARNEKENQRGEVYIPPPILHEEGAPG